MCRSSGVKRSRAQAPFTTLAHNFSGPARLVHEASEAHCGNPPRVIARLRNEDHTIRGETFGEFAEMRTDICLPKQRLDRSAMLVCAAPCSDLMD